MADNIAVTPGFGATVATDDIGGVQYQRVKIAWGSDGVGNDTNTATPLPVDINGMPGAAYTTDNIGSAAVTNAVMNGLTVLTPKFAKVAVASSGVNIVVAAVATKKLRVLGFWLSCSGTVNVKWQSHTTPTDLTGLLYGVANAGISGPFNPLGWFESLVGESLDLNLSGATAVGGCIQYVEI